MFTRRYINKSEVFVLINKKGEKMSVTWGNETYKHFNHYIYNWKDIPEDFKNALDRRFLKPVKFESKYKKELLKRGYIYVSYNKETKIIKHVINILKYEKKQNIKIKDRGVITIEDLIKEKLK